VESSPACSIARGQRLALLQAIGPGPQGSGRPGPGKGDLIGWAPWLSALLDIVLAASVPMATIHPACPPKPRARAAGGPDAAPRHLVGMLATRELQASRCVEKITDQRPPGRERLRASHTWPRHRCPINCLLTGGPQRCGPEAAGGAIVWPQPCRIQPGVP